MSRRFKKGINAWCFPSDFTLEQCFALAKETDYDAIEVNLGERNTEAGLQLALDSTEQEFAEILALSKRYELPISSVSTGMHWANSLTSNDETLKEKGKAVVRKMIDAAVYFGCDTVLVVPGAVTPDVSYKTAYTRAIESFNELKSYAEEKKIYIGVENVWNKFLLSPLEMARFIDEINSEYVKCYFDAGNVLLYSFPEHWVEVLGNRIVKVHVKDFDTQIGNGKGFKPLLQGSMNWPKLMQALENIGYNSYITAELSPYNYNPQQLVVDTSKAFDFILK